MSDLDKPFYGKDGKPVFYEDGRQATWADVMAEVGRMLREEGGRLKITEGPDGEELFQFTRQPEDES